MNTQTTVSQPATVPGSPLVQVSDALLGTIVLVLVAAWAIKRLGFAPKSTGTRGLKVTASISLGPHEHAVIVEVEDARLVPSIAASQINVPHTLPPAPVDAEEKTASLVDFQAMMKSLPKRPGRS